MKQIRVSMELRAPGLHTALFDLLPNSPSRFARPAESRSYGGIISDDRTNRHVGFSKFSKSL